MLLFVRLRPLTAAVPHGYHFIRGNPAHTGTETRQRLIRSIIRPAFGRGGRTVEIPFHVFNALDRSGIPNQVIREAKPVYFRVRGINARGNYQSGLIQLHPEVVWGEDQDLLTKVMGHEFTHHLQAPTERPSSELHAYVPREEWPLIAGKAEGEADRIGAAFNPETLRVSAYPTRASSIIRLSKTPVADLYDALNPPSPEAEALDKAARVQWGEGARNWTGGYLHGLTTESKRPGLELAPETSSWIRDFAESLR